MYELTIPLEEGSGLPFYEQIYQFLKKEIREKKIESGMRLPSTRMLALQLGVSRSTVTMAYEQLTAEGYVESRPCAGYFAAGLEGVYDLEEKETDLLTPEKEELSGKEKIQKESPVLSREESWIDFSPRGIDLEHFPYNTWKKLSKNLLTGDNRSLFLLGNPQGEERLRRAVSQYLRAARGIDCSPEQILIGAGNEYLLMLLDQLLGRDKKIAMEVPTYKQAYRVLRALGHEIIPVGMDKSGMRADQLEESGADAAYVMPSHQFPTGVVMPIKRRMELLSWARKKDDRYLIEDDYDSEFRYRGRPIPALLGTDQAGTVIYLGTFSRAVAPAIRISYMVLPPGLYRRYKENYSFYASTVPRLDQQIMALFLEEGGFERHLNRMRGIYRSKHDMLLEELDGFKGDFAVSGEYAGIHLLLTSRKGIKEEELIAGAAQCRVKVYGLSDCYIGSEKQEESGKETLGGTVILGYAGLTSEEIREGIKRLSQAWREG